MAFYSESIYLDLKKNLHGMNYTQLEASKTENQAGKYSQMENEIKKEDLGSKAYLFFEEKDIIKEDIKNVCLYVKNISQKDSFSNFPFQDVVTRINVILQKYTEQPSLLDNLVEPILSQIIDASRCYLKNFFEVGKNSETLPSIHPEFNSLVSIVYILSKVRGTKNVQKYLGHEVMDLEPLIFFMIANCHTDHWERLFFLLIWLSVVLLAPFNFTRFDFQQIRTFYAKKISSKNFDIIELLILDFLKYLLRMSSRIAEGISLCFRVLFRRPDMANILYITETIQWGMTELSNKTNLENSFYKSNIYKALCWLVKDTKREVLELFYKEIFEEISKINLLKDTKDETANVRSEKVHFILTLVDKLLKKNKSRPIYKIEKKKILESTQKVELLVEMITNKTVGFDEQKNGFINDLSNLAKEDENSENIEYLPLIEHVIDVILESLHDQDSNIRYLAAKQLAIIGLKLPQSLSDELLIVVLDLFAEENETSMHSVCLTIGEFCKRGLIAPKMLEKVIPVLKKAILFEESQGSYSTGSIVRDAACYICWTLAKAFDVETMRPYVQEFANAVLICALFDKNSNCRKAAAASFQENVGRQGYFSNGIAIISEMDYFSVSLRSNSYFKIAPFVGHFKEYTIPFLDHLSKVKLFHTEKEIRMESAKAMSLIGLFNPSYIIEQVLPILIENITNKSIQKRCGSILGISCILMTFSGNTKFMLDSDEKSENIFLTSLKINEKKLIVPGEYMKVFIEEFELIKQQNIVKLLPMELLKKVAEFPGKMQEFGLLKGKGGEITRIACMYLITGFSKAQIPLTNGLIETTFFTIEECLRTTIYDIHDAAIEALQEFLEKYLSNNPDLALKFIDIIIKRIDSELIKDIKKPMCRAIACFNLGEILKREDRLFELLISNSKVNKNIKMNDPEIRKYCINSINRLFMKMTPERLSLKTAKSVFDLLVTAINDYTVDKRGDIGLIIREEVIDVYQQIWEKMCFLDEKHEVRQMFLQNYLIGQIGGVLTQLVEPNDRIRLKAGFSMQKFVGQYSQKLPDFEVKQLLSDKFDNQILRNKFQEHQDQFFENYDVSLIDDKNFLSYKLNDQFVYFWNIPRCTFSHVVELLLNKSLNFYVLKGLVLSISSPMEGISTYAYQCLKNALEKNDEIKILVGNNLLKILRVFRNREKFFISAMKTFQMMIKNDLVLLEEHDKTLEEYLNELKMHCTKNASSSKVS